MLATYSAVYPEQTLLAAVKSWLSGYGFPLCGLKCSWFRYGIGHPPCEDRNNLNMATYSRDGQLGSMVIVKNTFDVDMNKYWNIYDSLVIDDLHQIGGIYKHLLSFIENMVKRATNQ